MDNYQLNRQQTFAPFVTKEARGLEIGAGYRPTFPKRDGFNVTVLDYCPTDELIAYHDGNFQIPKELVAQIEPVDVVCSGGSYSDLPGLAGSFDYVAACHVIEHSIDLCGFLKDCAALLKPGGHLLLAVPERSCIQDYYRPATTLGDVLLAHVAPHAYDVKSRMDEAWYGSLLQGAGAWSRAHLKHAEGEGLRPAPMQDLQTAQHIWHLSSGPLAQHPYRDAHRWVFDEGGFAELVNFVELVSGTGLHLVAMPGMFECEFYAILQKTAPPADAFTALERMRADMLALRQPKAE